MNVLQRLREHPDAPRWNHSAGDRLDEADRVALKNFAMTLRAPRAAHEPPMAWLHDRAPHVPAWKNVRFDTWEKIPTSSREDIAVRVETLIPDDVDLQSLIVYRTAGTTGHALLVPHHARAAASYQVLIAYALERYKIKWSPSAEDVACFLIGAQKQTVTYPTTLSTWGGAGFAKLNLHEGDWPGAGAASRYFDAHAPMLLTGDPISFTEMLRQKIPARPKAMISTAVAMSAGLRRKLSAAFSAPVIDWYSLTETGPLGYWCEKGEGYHVLAHDVFIEVIEANGAPTARGEIAVTGGRNPFLPLLRYRTGDFGRIDFAHCACGDTAPLLRDLEGRAPVLFRAADGSVLNPVDVSRVLREHALVQHALSQNADLSCELVVRPLENFDAERLRLDLRALFGAVPLTIREDATLGDRTGKVVPYRSQLLLED